jgi:hypothetical protein
MNRTEHLLFKLAEECAEVTQEASKAAIFGMDEVMPGQPLTNRDRVIKELNDLYAITEMLGICIVDRQHIEAKKGKVEHYMEYAEKECGTLAAAPPAEDGKEKPPRTYPPEPHSWVAIKGDKSTAVVEKAAYDDLRARYAALVESSHSALARGDR